MEMSEAREDAERAAEQSEQGMDEDALDWPDHMIEAGARAAWENWGGHGGAVRMVLEGGGSTWDKLSKIERAELKSDFAAGLNIVARSVKLVEEQAREEERIKTWEDAAVLMRSVIHTWSQPEVAGVQGSADPCRIRVTQEYANAFDAYAQGKGSPAIRVAKQREREKLAGTLSAKLTRLELDGKVVFEQERGPSMTDLITDEMVEKAAIATYEEMQRPNWRAPQWDEIDAPGQERFLNAARAALIAALTLATIAGLCALALHPVLYPNPATDTYPEGIS